jgi:hypothetical protein
MITCTMPEALLPRYDGNADVRALASAADAALAAARAQLTDAPAGPWERWRTVRELSLRFEAALADMHALCAARPNTPRDRAGWHDALGRFRSAQLNLTAVGVTTAGPAPALAALDKLEQSWRRLEQLLAARLGDVEESEGNACALPD